MACNSRRSVVSADPRDESTGARGPARCSTCPCEIGRVLGNQVELFYALGHERRASATTLSTVPAAMPSTDLRMMQKVHGWLQPFGDLHVGEMARRKPERGVS